MLGFQKTAPFVPQTIAVCGTARGVGTTHFALSLANYLCSKYRKRTAYVEMSKNNQIRSLADSPGTDEFDYMDIVCYPSAITEDLPHILAEHFAYVILDLGVADFVTGREFYRCDLKFVVACVSPWKAAQSCRTLESLIYNPSMCQDHIVLLGNLGDTKNLRRFRQLSGLPVKAIPFLQNPFHLTTANCTYFQEMLAQYGIFIPR